MANRMMVVSECGSLKRLPTSVASVSFWHIPGETMYDRAVVIIAYFDDLETAEKFQQKYEAPPEMACLEKLKEI